MYCVTFFFDSCYYSVGTAVFLLSFSIFEFFSGVVRAVILFCGHLLTSDSH